MGATHDDSCPAMTNILGAKDSRCAATQQTPPELSENDQMISAKVRSVLRKKNRPVINAPTAMITDNANSPVDA